MFGRRVTGHTSRMGSESGPPDSAVSTTMDDAAIFPLLTRLAAWGDANPERYGGSWIEPAAGGTPTVGVGVVGGAVPPALSALLKGEQALVVSVRHPLRYLEELADRIRRGEVQPGGGRVTEVGVYEPENVVDVRFDAADLATPEESLRATYRTDAIRVGRERRGGIIAAATTRRSPAG